MKYIKKIFDSDTRAGKIFVLTIQALILISLISFSIETIPNLNRETQFWLYIVEVVTVAIFTIEYGFADSLCQ